VQQSRNVSVSVTVGFAFIVGYFGLPFAMSLYLQQVRGLSTLAAGVAFLPMMLIGAALTPFTAPVWALALLMILPGLAGPTVMPPIMGVLLNSVPRHRAGTASGVFNTSRQVGGALAVALFGALLAHQGTFMRGLRASLLIAAAVVLPAAAASLLLNRPQGRHDEPTAPGEAIAGEARVLSR
jgi:sugar phosphate permease